MLFIFFQLLHVLLSSPKYRVAPLAAWSMMSWGGGRGRGVVPSQGEDCYTPPLGWLESDEGGFQKLGRSSKASIYYLLAGSLRDLHGFARDADVQGRSHADEFGRLRPGPGGIGLESMIQARSATPTLLLYGYSVQGSQVIFVREAAV